MGNKSASRGAKRASERAPKASGKATGKHKVEDPSAGAKVVRLARSATDSLRDESDAVRKRARGALRDVSRRVHHLEEEAEQLGSSAAHSAAALGRRAGTFASEHRYALILGALSIGLAATAQQLATNTRKKPVRYDATGAREGEGAASRVAPALSDAAAGAREGAQAVLHAAEHGLARVEHVADGAFSAHPLLMGGAVLAAGLAIGFALPASAREEELMEDVGRSLARQGKHGLDDLLAQAEHAITAATNVAKFASAALQSKR